MVRWFNDDETGGFDDSISELMDARPDTLSPSPLEHLQLIMDAARSVRLELVRKQLVIEKLLDHCAADPSRLSDQHLDEGITIWEQQELVPPLFKKLQRFSVSIP